MDTQKLCTLEKVPLKRDYSISCIRAIATFSIVLCHILQYYGKELAWWFNIGVEIFLVISGFLYGKKEIEDSGSFLWKNVKKILIPCLVWMGMVVVAYRIFARDTISLFDIVYPLVYGSTLPGLSHMWFVPYILFCYIITPILCSLRKQMTENKLRSILFIVLVFFAISYHRYEYSRVVCYIVGYFIGANLQEDKISRHKATWIFGGIAVVMNAVRIYFKYIGGVQALGRLQALFMCFESYSHTALGIALFLAMYTLFTKIGIKENGFLRFMDKYSYEIYLTHHIFMLSVFSVLSLTNFNSVNILLSLLLSLISAMALKLITNGVIKFINGRKIKK